MSAAVPSCRAPVPPYVAPLGAGGAVDLAAPTGAGWWCCLAVPGPTVDITVFAAARPLWLPVCPASSCDPICRVRGFGIGRFSAPGTLAGSHARNLRSIVAIGSIGSVTLSTTRSGTSTSRIGCLSRARSGDLSQARSGDRVTLDRVAVGVRHGCVLASPRRGRRGRASTRWRLTQQVARSPSGTIRSRPPLPPGRARFAGSG